jgi:cytochrome c-type biogenesis protein CcmH
MTSFWVIAAILSVMAVGFILVAFRRPAQNGPNIITGPAHSETVRQYCNQLELLEKNHAAGNISTAQYQLTKGTLTQKIHGVEKMQTKIAAQGEGSLIKALAVLVGILVPAADLYLYFKLGSPNMPGFPFAQQQEQAATDLQRMDGAVDQLTAALKKNPSDFEGWVLLGEAHRRNAHYKEAAQAFLKAAQLRNNDPTLLSVSGDMLVRSQQGKMTPETKKLFEHVLAKKPDDKIAKYYLNIK